MKVYKRKIDIYVASVGPDGNRWRYACSTNQSKTLKAAKARYWATHPGIHIDNIKASFA